MAWLVGSALPFRLLLEYVRRSSFSVVYRFVACKGADDRRVPFCMGLPDCHAFLCYHSRDYHLVINILIHTVMTMDITKSVAFTGHRSERIHQVGMLHLYLDIVSQVRRLYGLCP